LHLCLQSGSDRILTRMKRRYTRAGFLERCRRIRDALDQPAFSTDVIIGFPGETDEDFEATCSALREVGFCKVHVFSYSSRQGTPAAEMKEMVPPPVMARRRERLRQLGRELASSYQRSLLGRTLDVLVETADPERPGNVIGTSCRSVPVSFRGYPSALIRRCVPVRAVAVAEDGILGEPIAEGESLRGMEQQRERVSLPVLVSRDAERRSRAAERELPPT